MTEIEEPEWNETGARAAMTARRPDVFVEQHVAPLLYRRTRSANGHAEEFRREEDFWARASELTFSSVRLTEFRLTNWFPRAPGVYWSRYGVRARKSTWSEGTISDPKLGRIFRPRSKMDLIEEGGIGTIRLRPRRIDDTDCWLATAVHGAQCAGGIPLVVPDSVFREAGVRWGETVSIRGQVRFLDDAELTETAASVHHATGSLVFVDRIEGAPRRMQLLSPIIITPVVLFSEAGKERAKARRREWGGDFGYTFVQVSAGSHGELDDAEEWLETYADKFGGRIITNFDQHRPFLSEAPLSYQRLVQKTYDRMVIENLHFSGPKLADRIDHLEEVMTVKVTLGDGTVIHGDFIVANSIKESFARTDEGQSSQALKAALQRLSVQLGEVVDQLEPDVAQKAADDLETLTKEAARLQPRRQWWELSLSGIKEAAESMRDIGGPIVETVKALAPLLMDAS